MSTQTKIEKGKLLAGGKPFRIQGAAGTCEDLDILKKWGANAFRTYEPLGLRERLDDAVAHGLRLMVGLGIRYQEPETLETALKIVETYKTHPGVLLWCLGNELEIRCKEYEGIFALIEDAAKKVKAVDPTHVVAHMFMDFGSDPANPIVPYLKKVKNIDVLGFNTYLGAPSIADRYKKTIRIDKPFVVGEFGWMPAMLGRQVTWSETVRHEKSSTDKAMHYAASIRSFHGSELCIGSFVFRWGLGSPKDEVGGYTMPSETWHCVCLDGKRTAIADVLIEAWSGEAVPHSCPVLTSFTEYYYKGTKSHLKETTWTGISLVPPNNELREKETVTVKCKAEGGKGTTRYMWELRYHNTVHDDWPTIRRGAIVETEFWTTWSKPQKKKTAQFETTNPSIAFTAPPKGVYRMYVVVRDDDGGCAYASWPFRCVS